LNYRISLSAESGQKIIALTQLGTKFDHFSQKLTESWGDALAKALLMEESKVYEASCFVSVSAGQQVPTKTPTACRARIYETALVVLPSNALPIRLPFSYISTVSLESFKLKVSSSDGTVLELSRLGNQTQFFTDKLRDTMKKLESELKGREDTPPVLESSSSHATFVRGMIERMMTLSRMEGDDKGNVRILLHDSEFDRDAWVMMSGDDAAKLGAFPGAEVKLSLQKA
jgi:hypothetical protein